MSDVLKKFTIWWVPYQSRWPVIFLKLSLKYKKNINNRKCQGHHLGVNADDLATLVAVVGEHILVALDAVGVVVPQHVPTSKVNF
jgi:hypothetical protein